MPAHPVGADHHQRTDGVDRRFADGVAGGSLSLAWGFGGGRPVRVEGGNELPVLRDRPALTLPGWAVQLFRRRLRVIVESGEEVPPLGIDARGILQISGVQLFDESGVAAVEE